MQPDHTKEFILEVAASQYVLGAVLSQKNDKGSNQPVGYFLTLIPAERNYDVYDWELLAIVWSLQHWHHLLMGTTHPIVILTDHEGLTKYREPHNIRRWVAHYLPVLAEYNMIIKH
jgi:hypothetical protein